MLVRKAEAVKEASREALESLEQLQSDQEARVALIIQSSYTYF